MEIILKKFKKLTSFEVYQLLKLRQDVFIIEQNCIYPDIDDSDERALHLMFFEGKKLIAYSRIFKPGIKFNSSSSIGRIVVSSNSRGSTIGKLLIDKSIEYCKGLFPNTPITIEAQSALESYYKQFGFKTESSPYLVDGIAHIKMVLKIQD